MATDYISRDSVLDLTARKNSVWDKITDSSGRGLTEIVNSVPAADVVEVVRCRDCVHLCMTGLGTWCFFHPQGSLGHDDFCSAGERRQT